MAEKVIAAFGLLLVIALAGVLLYEAFWGGTLPAAVTVAVENVRNVPGGYLVEVVATNHGDETGAQVRIAGELRQGGKVVERSEATFSYVPEQSEQRGGLFFTEDPGRYDLQVRATGYEEP